MYICTIIYKDIWNYLINYIWWYMWSFGLRASGVQARRGTGEPDMLALWCRRSLQSKMLLKQGQGSPAANVFDTALMQKVDVPQTFQTPDLSSACHKEAFQGWKRGWECWEGWCCISTFTLIDLFKQPIWIQAQEAQEANPEGDVAERPKPKRLRKAGLLQLGCFAHVKLDQFYSKKTTSTTFTTLSLRKFTSSFNIHLIHLKVQPAFAWWSPFLVRPRRSRPRLPEPRPLLRRRRPRKGRQSDKGPEMAMWSCWLICKLYLRIITFYSSNWCGTDTLESGGWRREIWLTSYQMDVMGSYHMFY